MSLYLGNNCISAGGSSAFRNTNIGEIIQSTLPLTDAGLHLLDGSLISGSGSYSAFVTHIAGLVSNYPNCFCSESDWQTAVATYGVCGKFVYDSVNNTVRLPKITGFTEGTITPTSVGVLTEAGLPNITIEQLPSWDAYSSSGALLKIGDTGFYSFSGGGSLDTSRFDASRSSSKYGNSSTVQPQAIKVLYYICIATATKTSIEVDIDEIATDLNGKADVDLTNCTKPHLVSVYDSGATHVRIYSDGWCEQSWHANSPSTINTTLALPTAFKDTNYTVLGAVSDCIDLYICGITAYPATNSTFYALTTYSGTGYVQNCNWYACGYVS